MAGTEIENVSTVKLYHCEPEPVDSGVRSDEVDNAHLPSRDGVYRKGYDYSCRSRESYKEGVVETKNGKLQDSFLKSARTKESREVLQLLAKNINPNYKKGVIINFFKWFFRINKEPFTRGRNCMSCAKAVDATLAQMKELDSEELKNFKFYQSTDPSKATGVERLVRNSADMVDVNIQRGDGEREGDGEKGKEVVDVLYQGIPKGKMAIITLPSSNRNGVTHTMLAIHTAAGDLLAVDGRYGKLYDLSKKDGRVADEEEFKQRYGQTGYINSMVTGDTPTWIN